MQDFKQPGFWKFLDTEVYLHRDVVVEGKIVRAIERWGRWFMVPMNVTEPGPVLETSKATEVTREHVYSQRLVRDVRAALLKEADEQSVTNPE